MIIHLSVDQQKAYTPCEDRQLHSEESQETAKISEKINSIRNGGNE